VVVIRLYVVCTFCLIKSDEYEDPPDEESFEVPGKMMMFAYIHLYLRKALCTYLLGIDL
jgi:hypothetical protein